MELKIEHSHMLITLYRVYKNETGTLISKNAGHELKQSQRHFKENPLCFTMMLYLTLYNHRRLRNRGLTIMCQNPFGASLSYEEQTHVKMYLMLLKCVLRVNYPQILKNYLLQVENIQCSVFELKHVSAEEN